MAEPAKEPDYATKEDIDVLRAEMTAGFAELRGEMRTETATVEARTMRTLYAGAAALLAGQAASVLNLLRLLGQASTIGILNLGLGLCGGRRRSPCGMEVSS